MPQFPRSDAILLSYNPFIPGNHVIFHSFQIRGVAEKLNRMIVDLPAAAPGRSLSLK